MIDEQLSLEIMQNIIQCLLKIDAVLMALVICIVGFERPKKLISVCNPNPDGSFALIWSKTYAKDTKIDKIVDCVQSILIDITFVSLTGVSVVLLLSVIIYVFLYIN